MRTYKLLMWLGVAALTSAWTQLPASAQQSGPKTSAEYLAFGTPPFELDGTFMVPLDKIAEWLGVRLETKDEEVTAEKGSTKLLLKVGNSSATLDGLPFSLAAPVTVKEKKSFAPSQSFCKAFGATVQWDEQQRVFVIVSAEKYAKIVTPRMPVGQSETVWVFSVPLGCAVYVRQQGEKGKALPETFFIGLGAVFHYNWKSDWESGAPQKGVTPIALKLAPGTYEIEVVAPLTEWQPAFTWSDSSRMDIDDLNELMNPKDRLCWEFERGNATHVGAGTVRLVGIGDFEGARVSVVKEGSSRLVGVNKSGQPMGGGVPLWSVNSVGQTYLLTTKEGEQGNVIASFQRQDKSLEDLVPHLPLGDNFVFDDTRLTKELKKCRIRNEDLPLIVRILHKGGKVVCQSKKRKYVVEITGDNKWSITAL